MCVYTHACARAHTTHPPTHTHTHTYVHTHTHTHTQIQGKTTTNGQIRRMEAKLKAALEDKADLEQRFSALLAISDVSATRLHSPPVNTSTSRPNRTPFNHLVPDGRGRIGEDANMWWINICIHAINILCNSAHTHKHHTRRMFLARARRRATPELSRPPLQAQRTWGRVM